MSEKKKHAPRKRKPLAPRDRIKPMAAPLPTLEQVQAENVKLRERNEQLEERNEQLSNKVIVPPEEVAQKTDDASRFAETIGTESREDELVRLLASTARLERELRQRREEERELRERREKDRINAAHAQAFELIKQLATYCTRLESIEVRPATDRLLNRAIPYEAVLVVTYSAGTHRFTAVAGDPARALLEALAQFTDQMRVRKVPPAEDLGTLFALIDNQ